MKTTKYGRIPKNAFRKHLEQALAEGREVRVRLRSEFDGSIDGSRSLSEDEGATSPEYFLEHYCRPPADPHGYNGYNILSVHEKRSRYDHVPPGFRAYDASDCYAGGIFRFDVLVADAA